MSNRPVPTDKEIKWVAMQAACNRWDISSSNWPTWTNFQQTDTDYWKLTYDEPDTGTPEEVRVQLVGNELHAYAETTDIPVVYKLPKS